MLSIVRAAIVDPQSFGNAISPIITNVVYPVIELLVGVAFIVFVWSIVKMIINGGDSDEREKARWSMFGGLIGMVIMMSAWGIIYLVSNTVKTI